MMLYDIPYRGYTGGTSEGVIVPKDLKSPKWNEVLSINVFIGQKGEKHTMPVCGSLTY